MAQDTQHRAQAVRELADNQEGSDGQGFDHCGPEPERPSYFSPPEVRQRWLNWKMCKSGAE